MKKFGIAGITGIAATGLAAAILGFAAPAQADVRSTTNGFIRSSSR